MLPLVSNGGNIQRRLLIEKSGTPFLQISLTEKIIMAV